MIKLYKRLKDLREDHDLTQTQVAQILGIRQSDYGKYERGINMMGVDKYIKLAEYYNVSVDYLLGLIPIPRPLSEKIQLKIENEKLCNAFNQAEQDIQKVIKILLKMEKTNGK